MMRTVVPRGTAATALRERCEPTVGRRAGRLRLDGERGRSRGTADQFLVEFDQPVQDAVPTERQGEVTRGLAHAGAQRTIVDQRFDAGPESVLVSRHRDEPADARPDALL